VGAGCACLGLAGAASAAAAQIGASPTKGAWTFVSAPLLHPPKLMSEGRTSWRSLAPGDFLLANFPNVATKGPMTGEGGPLIVDNSLRPVWFAPVGTGQVAANLQQETYGGKPVLVWWQGTVTSTGATVTGEDLVDDSHYRRLATLRARSPWTISLHDAAISGSDIWVTVYRYVHDQNLTRYGGSRNGIVYDAGVQEYDLKTGHLLDTWDPLNPGGTPHIPLAASEQPAAPGKPWDAYHVNSVQPLPGGRMLVSMRNTWAAYLIDVATGKIVWTLGGKASSFKAAAGARFAWQHDVRLVGTDEVTLFDDDCCQLFPSGSFASPSGSAKSMLLRLNLASHTVSLVASYRHSPALVVAFLGSTQILPNQNVLVGWGSKPYFTEFSRSGRSLLDVLWPGKDLSYRALYSATWNATPYYPPRGAARTVHNRTTVYASWNGATEVRSWRVLGGTSAAHLSRVASAHRNGFETAISMRSYKLFEVQALGANDKVLGTSKAFSAS
jgi:Arylsulfotransferase (ASST)